MLGCSFLAAPRSSFPAVASLANTHGGRILHAEHHTTPNHTMKTANPDNQPILDSLLARSDRSAWGRGVNLYAIELVEECEQTLTRDNCYEVLRNGADNWEQYSFGGCSLIYDSDIAERLCTPSELRKTRGGERQPNNSETWLDCQARALFQAAARIRRAMCYSITDHATA
jgi:hypothetical protein